MISFVLLRLLSTNMSKTKSKKRVKNELSLEERFQILDEHEKSAGSLSVRKLADKYECGKTQISNIIKNKATIREEYETDQRNEVVLPSMQI